MKTLLGDLLQVYYDALSGALFKLSDGFYDKDKAIDTCTHAKGIISKVSEILIYNDIDFEDTTSEEAYLLMSRCIEKLYNSEIEAIKWVNHKMDDQNKELEELVEKSKRIERTLGL